MKVIIDNAILIQNGLQCSHCGAAIVFNLPLPVHKVVALMRAFSALHKFCGYGQPVFKEPEGGNHEPKTQKLAGEVPVRP